MNLGEGLIAGLSGLGKGAAVYPGALQAGSQQALGEAQLAEAMQHRQFQESQANTPLASLAGIPGLEYLKNQTGKIPTTGLPATLSFLEKNQQAQFPKLEPITENTTGFINPRTQQITPVPRTPQAPFTPPEGYKPTYTIDKLGKQSTTYHPPAEPAKSAIIDTARNRLIAEAQLNPGAPQPGTPQFDIELGKRTEQMIPVGPDVELWRKSAVPTQPTVNAPAPPQPGPVPAPSPALKRPPTATNQETQTAADAQSWIQMARAAADKLEGYMSSLNPVQRASFASRVSLQGMPGLKSQELTSKEEREITSAIGNLQIAWERASGGLRMASSPQMQDRIRQIFGDPTNAATPQHLRTIAGQMEQELHQRAQTEQQAGRRPIAISPGGLKPAPSNGWGPARVIR